MAAIGYMILQKDCSWLHLRLRGGALGSFFYFALERELTNIRRMEERGKIVSMIEDKIKYDIRSVVWDE